MPSGVEYGEGLGVPSQQTRGLGERREPRPLTPHPSGVWGGAPVENGFWLILKATEVDRTLLLYIHDKI